MKVDIRDKNTKVDKVVFADTDENYMSNKDAFMGDYATEVEYSDYGGITSIEFECRYIRLRDWENVKKAVDLLLEVHNES